jgi:hypothetical protein
MNRVRNSCFGWFMIIGPLLLPSRSLSQAPPKDLREWELICYCSGREKGPDEIVREDNNGQILAVARRGATRQTLGKNGIAFTESQIELLKDWRLLSEQDGELKTFMPVLGPDEINRLRSLLSSQAKQVGKSLAPDFENLVAMLTRSGYGGNAYSIVFSYVLDGMVWDEFGRMHVLPSMEITADKPFWSGAVWAVYPRRDSPGTNSRSYGGWDLFVTWTRSVQPLLKPLNDSTLTQRLLKDLESHGSESDPAIRSQLAALGILTSEGKPAVPIIREGTSDAIYVDSLALSRKLSEEVLRVMQADDIPAVIGTGDRGVALVMAYHEFMWELLAYLEESGIIHVPAALAGQEQADPMGTQKLVFFVVPQSK